LFTNEVLTHKYFPGSALIVLYVMSTRRNETAFEPSPKPKD